MQLYAIHKVDYEVFRFPSANVYSLPRDELVGTEILLIEGISPFLLLMKRTQSSGKDKMR